MNEDVFNYVVEHHGRADKSMKWFKGNGFSIGLHLDQFYKTWTANLDSTCDLKKSFDKMVEKGYFTHLSEDGFNMISRYKFTELGKSYFIMRLDL